MSTCANIFVQVPQKYKYIRRFGHAKHRCNTLHTKHIRHNFAYVKQPIAVATYRGKTNFKSKIMSLNEIIQSGPKKKPISLQMKQVSSYMLTARPYGDGVKPAI